MRKIVAYVVLVLGLALPGGGCSNDGPQRTGWADGWFRSDLGGFPDAIVPRDLGLPPDGLPSDKDGPTIVIQSPAAGATVIGNTLKVLAKVTDPDQVDPSSVKVTLQGGATASMTITTKDDVYEGLLDVTAAQGAARLWVVAADLGGKKNSAKRDFTRDGGPSIAFQSPATGSRHKGEIPVLVLVSDPTGIKSFGVRLGGTTLTLTALGTDPNKQVYKGTLNSDSFTPPLSGTQVLVAEAENTGGAKTSATRSFIVDDQGPVITILSQNPGDLVGGIIGLKAQIKDDAGVVASTVTCVIGNGATGLPIQLKSSTGSPDVYEGQFDTRSLKSSFLWPVLSFRAADTLSNESHEDIQVGVDNGQPIIEMDPPETFHTATQKNNLYECSRAFDPVGDDAVDDLQRVPQVSMIRARIEDQGNLILSANYIPVAMVDSATPYLYILDDTSKALVVDTDGDGWCDSINQEVVPVGSTPAAGEAVAVKLSQVTPAGSADYRYPFSLLPSDAGAASDGGSSPAEPPPAGCDTWGSATSAPSALCLGTPLTVATPYTNAKQGALWAIPPVNGSKTSYTCAGLPFDFLANNISSGWVCVAAEANDELDNRGVSMPLRLYVDYDPTLTAPTDNLPASAGTPPDCTGTLDKTTGQVDATKHCKFRNPREGSDPSTKLFKCDTTTILNYPQAFCHNEVIRL